MATGCVQDPDAPMNQPDLPTLSVDESTVTRVSMVVNGIFSKDMTDITEYGVEISETLFEAGGTYKTLVPQEIGADGFSLGVTGLTLNQTYFLRAFIGNGYSKLYSSTIIQKTPESSVASISDVTIVDNQYFVATIEDNGGRNLEDVGFVWGETNDRKAIRREKRYPGTLSADGKTITLPMSDIGKGTYYVLAYAEDDKDGTGFSRIPFELVLRDDVPPVKPDQPVVNKYLTFTSEGTTKISLITSGGRSPVVYYSYNADTWTKWDYSELEFSADNPLYICGDNPDGFSSSKGIGGSFKTSGDYYAVQGDIMSLLNYSKDMSTVPAGCFYALFCESVELKIAPELPATTLGDECYGSIFAGCSALIVAPALPATTLSYACYLKMFERCTGLVSAPELPSDNLAEFCYEEMFCGCTSLTTAPTLPATTLAKGCYYYMFEGCSNLTSSPELKATILAEECYKEMFRNCTKLNYVKCLATDINADDCVSDWLYNVASSGTFVKSSKMNDWTRGPSGIPEGWTVENDGEETIHPSKYLTFTSEGTTRLSLMNYGLNEPILYFSSDGINWTEWDYSPIQFSNGSPLYLCGDNNNGFGTYLYNYSTFIAEGDLFDCSGSIMSLLNSSSDLTEIPQDYCFYRLFNGCSLLKSSPEFPATVLKSSCYASAFYDCVNLTDAPDLPSTVMMDGCYSYMFYNCKSLKVAPELPATTLAYHCYGQMFCGCKNLIEAPTLPALDLAHYCYSYMFGACESLVDAPALPATTLTSYCYEGMFSGCTSLTPNIELPAVNLAEGCYQYMFTGCSFETAPNLPATTLVDRCYLGIFGSCYSLKNAPELPATTLAPFCYQEMFSGCTSLETAPQLPATTLAINCYCRMFWGCKALINPPTLPVMDLPSSCYLGMFQGCSALKNAPELPAIILSSSCYYEMFRGCSSLENAPILSSTSLANHCYAKMFYECSSMRNAPELPATELCENCYESMFYKCSSLTVAPSSLPSNALESYCYYAMFYECTELKTAPIILAESLENIGCGFLFYGCKSLNYVKCLATEIQEGSIGSWMYGVAPTGTFVKSPQMNDWPIGMDGIPEGWTVVDDGSVAVTGITLDKESVSIKVGESATITPQVAPASATNKSVTWTSDHPEFASVSGGVVTGVSAGTAVITATTVDGGFTATCTVTVKNKTNSGGNEDFDFENW